LDDGIFGGQMSQADDAFRLPYASPERPDKQWEEWFHDYHSRKLMRIEFAPEKDAPLRLSGTLHGFPGLALNDMTCSAGISRHTTELIEDDDIFFVAALSGEVATLHQGEHVRIGDGTVAIGSNDAVGYMNLKTDTRFSMVRLTRRMLEPLVPNLNDALKSTYLHDSPALRLLFGYAGALLSGSIGPDPELRHLVSAHVHDLAAVALGPGRDGAAIARGRGVRAGRLAGIKTDILEHLADPALSVASVARRQGLTPRYVHMLFEDEGNTFSEYVVSQRLGRAYRMLIDPRRAHETISAVAMAVGFGDLSYFNRTFRRRFGATPTEIRSAGRG